VSVEACAHSFLRLIVVNVFNLLVHVVSSGGPKLSIIGIHRFTVFVSVILRGVGLRSLVRCFGCRATTDNWLQIICLIRCYPCHVSLSVVRMDSLRRYLTCRVMRRLLILMTVLVGCVVSATVLVIAVFKFEEASDYWV